jgi:hypothetical protein
VLDGKTNELVIDAIEQPGSGTVAHPRATLLLAA